MKGKKSDGCIGRWTALVVYVRMEFRLAPSRKEKDPAFGVVFRWAEIADPEYTWSHGHT